MKATKIVLSLAVIGTLTLGFAATPATTTVPTTVDAQITAIQNAPASQRVELMNEFKTQLSTMNAEDRSAAISQMREKMQAQMQEHSGAGEMGEMNREQMQDKMESRGEMGREQIQEHATEMQMEHSDEMNRVQGMNQQQAGSQFGHENEQAGGSKNMEGVVSPGASSMPW